MTKVGSLLVLTLLALVGGGFVSSPSTRLYLGDVINRYGSNVFGSNVGLSISTAHPYPQGYVGIRLENTAIDGTVRQVMATDKYQWSIRADTDCALVIHKDGPAGSDMRFPDAPVIRIPCQGNTIEFYGDLVVYGRVHSRP